MVRVLLNPDELDGNFRIEYAILQTLAQRLIAEVPAEEITKNYQLPNHSTADTGTLEEKCEAIVKKLDLHLETFMSGYLAVFKPRDR